MIFDFLLLESILVSRINFGKSEFFTERIDYEIIKIFLLFVKISFKETIKYKLFYFKINSNKINFI